MNFEETVYQVVKLIPRGSVLTYREVARRAGNSRAARAVGNAMAKNKNWPRIPCHRVVCSDGTIGHWSGRGGKKRKILLLRKEGHFIEHSKFLNLKS